MSVGEQATTSLDIQLISGQCDLSILYTGGGNEKAVSGYDFNKTITPTGTLERVQSTCESTVSGSSGLVIRSASGTSYPCRIRVTRWQREYVTNSVDKSATDYQKTTVSPTAGAEIPRDESDITKDVLGNDLQHVGLVKLNADFKESNCATLDGTDDYGSITVPTTGTLEVEYDIITTSTSAILLTLFNATDKWIGIFTSGNSSTKLRGSGFTTGNFFIDGVEFVNNVDTRNQVYLALSDGQKHTVKFSNLTASETGGSLTISGKSSWFLAAKVFNVKIKHNGASFAEFPIAEGKGTVSSAREDKTKYIMMYNGIRTRLLTHLSRQTLGTGHIDYQT